MNWPLLSSTELATLLYANDINPNVNFAIADENFACLTIESLLGPVAADTVDYCNVMELRTWKTDRNDCDNFAHIYQGRAHAAYNKTVNDLVRVHGSKAETNAGLAVGMVWYQEWRTGPHAINIAVVKKGRWKTDEWSKLSHTDRVQHATLNRFWQLVHIEPQYDLAIGGKPSIVHPSTKERESCSGYFFF